MCSSGPEHGRGGDVPFVSRICGTHHFSRVPHFLSQLWYGECSILLRPLRRQRRETNHDKCSRWNGKGSPPVFAYRNLVYSETTGSMSPRSLLLRSNGRLCLLGERRSDGGATALCLLFFGGARWVAQLAP
ncbi:hypothetical protein PIB30_050795 [Stylosanthes scabra]|uniref:Uncharacterized protein n=1 Tax=Stylosanthes scabra TaxID=79078 RepID=A0ABU6QH12_9FABA|nr:hypothetical protein [Stylosanthes scabra]